ncbi:MAG: type II toxin-antitoxin system RelE/ParE family toxin [Patescibacteria group bacterium]|jgi:phage-related protein
MIQTVKYQLIFYKTSSGKDIITDYILNCENNLKNKIRTGIKIFEDYGLELLKTKWLKKIYHNPSIYELRITGGKQIRFLFIQYNQQVFLIIHVFVKKTQKIPIKELKIALKRTKEFI